MKSSFFLIICAAVTILMAGCGKPLTFNEPTIEVYKDGKIRQTIVESFDKPYYDENELRAEFDDALEKYNNSNDSTGKISLIDLHVSEGDVFASLEYESYKAANAFQDVQMFYGTVGEACDEGYSFDVVLKGTEDDVKIEKSGLAQIKDKHVFITGESGLIEVPKSIMYVSANIEPVSDKIARVSSDSSGLAYIVTK